MTSRSELLGASSASRQQRLAGRVRDLRTRASAGGLDRWLLVAGGVMVPLGLLLVLLGWLGASHTVLVFEQVPYLISGGVLGTALVFGGCFVYFAYWQTVRVRDARAHQKELVDSLHRIEALLLAGGNGGRAPERGQTNGTGGMLVSTESGTMLHRPDCPVVVGRDNVRPVAADTPGLRPCRICQPLASAAR